MNIGKLAQLCVAFWSLALVTDATPDVTESAVIEASISRHLRVLTDAVKAKPPIQTGTLPMAHAPGSPRAAQTKVVRWGPFKIPAATNKGPGIIAYPGYKLDMPCTECYITSMAFALVREDGSPLNYGTDPPGRGSWAVINTARAGVPPCGSLFFPFFEPVFAAGNERTGLVLPPGYGYYNPWYSSWMAGSPVLQNFSPEILTAYLELTVSFVPATASGMKHTTFIALNQADCDYTESGQFYKRTPLYTIPQGYSDSHKEWIADRGGEMVAAVGHLHDYGISVALENATTRQYMCTSIAGYANGSPFQPVGPGSGVDELHPTSHHVLHPGNSDYAGHIEHTDVCLPRLHVSKGDILRLHTQYNSPKPLADVMGSFGIYMHVTDPPPCTLAMGLSYDDTTLRVLFTVGTPRAIPSNPVQWNLWLATETGMVRLLSTPLPAIEPSLPVLFSFSGFPHSGRIGFLATLTTSAGIICSSWNTIDTGPVPSPSGRSAGELRELFLKHATLGAPLSLPSHLFSDLRGPSATLGACHLGHSSSHSPTHLHSHVFNPGGGHVEAMSTPVFNPANQHYYEAISAPEGIDFVRAVLEAEKRSFKGFPGHLATVTSHGENDFIASNFPEITGEFGYWLGGYRDRGPASLIARGWGWRTHEAMVYTNWQPGTPDRPEGPDAIHYSTTPGRWNNRSVFDTVAGYVVEYEPSCSLHVDSSYHDTTLDVNVTTSTQEPTTWNLWLVVRGTSVPIVSGRRVNKSRVDLSIPFPHTGAIGLLTTLTTSKGTICSDWKTVDTGQPFHQ